MTKVNRFTPPPHPPTFHNFWLPCAQNTGFHIHVHTVKPAEPPTTATPPTHTHTPHTSQYVTLLLFSWLKEVISPIQRVPFLTTSVLSLLVAVSTFSFLLIPLSLTLSASCMLVSAAVFLIKWRIHREMGISFRALHSSPSCLHSWITG